MVIIIEYRIDKTIGFRVVNTGAEIMCPVCGGKLVGYGWRERKYIESDGRVTMLHIHRLTCTKCNDIHHELPDILVPYKRHCAETIEDVIAGRDDDICCEESTVRRIRYWWQTLCLYFKGICGALAVKHGVCFTDPLTLREAVRAAVNSHLWVSTRSACPSG